MDTGKQDIALRSLTIENFKSFGAPVTIPFKPITMLFGGNSAGKSTVLKALLYFRGVLQEGAHPTHVRVSGKRIDFGTFRDVVHGHDTSREIVITGEFQLLDPKPKEDRNPRQINLKERLETILGHPFRLCTIQVTVSEDVAGVEIGFDGEAVGYSDMGSGTIGLFTGVKAVKDVFLDWPKRGDEDWFTQEQLESIDLSISCGMQFNFFEPFIDSDFSPPTANRTDLGNFIKEYNSWLGSNGRAKIRSIVAMPIRHAVKALANELRYIGPLRELPKRNQALRQVPERNWYDGMAAWKELETMLANKLLSDIQQWKIVLDGSVVDPRKEALDEIKRLNLGYDFALRGVATIEIPAGQWSRHDLLSKKNNKEIIAETIERDADNANQYCLQDKLVLIDSVTKVEVHPSDVGTGVSQALPIAVGAFADGCTMMAVEQPELHLHPRLQCDLGDIFIANMHRHPDRLFLIETHSEHLILRLLRRMRETASGNAPKGLELKPIDVAVLAFEAGENGTEVHEMEISESGELLTPWPNGFFPERMNEILGE